jgi:hypothetical protein
MLPETRSLASFDPWLMAIGNARIEHNVLVAAAQPLTTIGIL